MTIKGANVAVQGGTGGGRTPAPPLRPNPPGTNAAVGSANKRPEVVWHLGAILLIAVQLVATKIGTFSSNLFAALLGLLASVVLLGLSRARDARRRADGRFTDWGLVSSASCMSLLTLASWAIGVANVFFVAKELTR